MEVAIQLGGGQLRGAKARLEELLEQARLAEMLGFDAIFVPDHYLYEQAGRLDRRTPAYDPFFLLATLAQQTKRARLGTQVACTLFRHPAMHARLFAQIDEASHGRVIAGVGAGWSQAEFEMIGLPFPPIAERLRILDESVEILRGLWCQERLDYRGTHFQLDNAACLPRPIQKPGPPLMLGGGGRGILERAGAWADIAHVIPKLGEAGTTTVREIRAFSDARLATQLARVRAAEARAGRPAGSVRLATSVFRYVPTRTRGATLRAAEQLAGLLGGSPEDVLRHPVALIGTPDEIVDEIVRRRDSHDLSLLVIDFSGESEQMQAFAELVLANVR